MLLFTQPINKQTTLFAEYILLEYYLVLFVFFKEECTNFNKEGLRKIHQIQSLSHILFKFKIWKKYSFNQEE
jgi:hypothetical protein